MKVTLPLIALLALTTPYLFCAEAEDEIHEIAEDEMNEIIDLAQGVQFVRDDHKVLVTLGQETKELCINNENTQQVAMQDFTVRIDRDVDRQNDIIAKVFIKDAQRRFNKSHHDIGKNNHCLVWIRLQPNNGQPDDDDDDN